MPHSCFCEAIRSNGIKQPANTWSSLGFLVVAVFVLARWAREPSVRKVAYPVLYAITLIVVGLGSAWFHATLTFNAQFADVLGMYLVATFALLYSIGRLRPLSPSALTAAYIGINAALSIMLYSLPVVRRWVFALLLVAVFLVEFRNRQRSETKHLWIAGAIMAFAFVIWTLDYTRVVCNPNTWIQGHAVWHILGAIAAWYLLLYFSRSPRDSYGNAASR